MSETSRLLAQRVLGVDYESVDAVVTAFQVIF